MNSRLVLAEIAASSNVLSLCYAIRGYSSVGLSSTLFSPLPAFPKYYSIAPTLGFIWWPSHWRKVVPLSDSSCISLIFVMQRFLKMRCCSFSEDELFFMCSFHINDYCKNKAFAIGRKAPISDHRIGESLSLGHPNPLYKRQTSLLRAIWPSIF